MVAPQPKFTTKKNNKKKGKKEMSLVFKYKSTKNVHGYDLVSIPLWIMVWKLIC